MKYRTIQLIILLVLLASATEAQNLIAVQNGGEAEFYTNLDSAIVHASNGDTVYIPGGTFSVSVQIDKRLHIIGVGHNPDSTLATGQTRITGNLSLVNEASNGSLMGVYLSGYTTSGDNISNYLVLRCSFNGINLPSSSTNWIFIENIIQYAYQFGSEYAVNCYFYNNIIGAYSNYNWAGFASSVFKNNIFLVQYEGCGYQCLRYPIKASSSNFENNIFISNTHTLQQCVNSSFYNH